MSSILVRRANMVAAGSTPGRLPAGYTELAYLESTGTQRINTGIIPTSDTEVYVIFEATTNSKLVYDTSSTSSVNGMYCQVGTSTNMNRKSSRPSISLNNKHTLIQNRDNVTVDGTAYNYNAAVPDFTGALQLRLMGGGGVGFIGKTYGFVVRSNGSEQLNLVPAMRDSDSVVGMYDSVSNTFLTNAGSGTFNYGTV